MRPCSGCGRARRGRLSCEFGTAAAGGAVISNATSPHHPRHPALFARSVGRLLEDASAGSSQICFHGVLPPTRILASSRRKASDWGTLVWVSRWPKLVTRATNNCREQRPSGREEDGSRRSIGCAPEVGLADFHIATSRMRSYRRSTERCESTRHANGRTHAGWLAFWRGGSVLLAVALGARRQVFLMSSSFSISMWRSRRWSRVIPSAARGSAS